MTENQEKKKKGFWARLMEKLDKKMEEKAKQAPCCSAQKDKKEDSCC